MDATYAQRGRCCRNRAVGGHHGGSTLIWELGEVVIVQQASKACGDDGVQQFRVAVANILTR